MAQLVILHHYIHSHEAEAVGREGRGRKEGGREGEEKMLGLHPLEWVLPNLTWVFPLT